VSGDDDVFDLLDVSGQTDPLHQVQFAGLDQVTAADVQVVAGQCRKHVVQSQVEFYQAGRLDQHLVLLALSAPGVDFGHSWYRLQPRLDDPVV